MSRYRFVEAEKGRYPVTQLCRMAQVSRAAYYQWQEGTVSPRQVADAALTAAIRAIHAASGGQYGVPRVLAELRALPGRSWDGAHRLLGRDREQLAGYRGAGGLTRTAGRSVQIAAAKPRESAATRVDFAPPCSLPSGGLPHFAVANDSLEYGLSRPPPVTAVTT
jgi:hypothetical protein